MINNKNAIKNNIFALNDVEYKNNIFNSTKHENKVGDVWQNLKDLNFNDAKQFYDAFKKIQR